MEEKIYIRPATTLIMKTDSIRSIRTIEAKQGSRGKYNVAGDENGLFDFPDNESRDAKIAELVAQGCILKPAK